MTEIRASILFPCEVAELKQYSDSYEFTELESTQFPLRDRPRTRRHLAGTRHRLQKWHIQTGTIEFDTLSEAHQMFLSRQPNVYCFQTRFVKFGRIPVIVWFRSHITFFVHNIFASFRLQTLHESEAFWFTLTLRFLHSDWHSIQSTSFRLFSECFNINNISGIKISNLSYFDLKSKSISPLTDF